MLSLLPPKQARLPYPSLRARPRSQAVLSRVSFVSFLMQRQIFMYILDTKQPLQANINGGRNKFADLSSPIVPPAIPVWQDALSSVDINPVNIVYKTRPHNSGYVFPDPGLFVGASNAERQAKYLYHWIQHRMEMIYRLTSAQSSARSIPSQLWRDLLNFGAEASVGEAHTKAAKHHQQIIEMFGDCVAADRVEVSTNIPSSEPSWRDQQISAGILPTEAIAQEILWELSELNFRFELLALDQRASTVIDEDYATRQDKVLACFPAFLLLVADTRDAA